MKKKIPAFKRSYCAAAIALCIAVIISVFSMPSLAALTDHIFIIKDHITDDNIKTPRTTYHFLQNGELYSDDDLYISPYYYFKNDANVDVCIQIVKNGEKLVEPTLPPPITVVRDGHNTVYRFCGWYVVEPEEVRENSVTYRWSAETERFDFGQNVSVSEDSDVYLAPLYQNAKFLVFHEDTIDGRNSKGIVSRRLINMNGYKDGVSAEIQLDEIKAPLQNSYNEYFYGWSYYDADGIRHEIPFYTSEGTEIGSVSFTVKGDMFSQKDITVDDTEYIIGDDATLELFPIYVNAHWLNFDTAITGGGAVYTESKFVTQNTIISKLETSSMNGYKFRGWYSQDGVRVADENGTLINNITFEGGSVTDGHIRLVNNTTLSARWEADGTTSYKVVYWFENGTDEGYTYGSHIVRQNNRAGTVTAEVPPETPTVDPPNGAAKIGFHLYGSDLTHYPDETDPDYRPENQQAAIANDGSTVVNIYYNRNDVTLTFRYQKRNNSNISTADPVVYTLKRKYGEKIKDVFGSSPFSDIYQYVKWEDAYGTVYDKNSPFKTLEEMPEQDVTVCGIYSSTKTGDIYYYTEMLPGETSDIVFDGRYFELYKLVRHNFNYLTYKEDFHLIEGFYAEKNHASPAFDRSGQAKINNSPYNYKLYYYRSKFKLRFMFHDGFTEDKLIENISYQQQLADKISDDELSQYVAGKYEEDINNVRMVFMGWYDNPALEGEPFDIYSGTMPSHDVTLHAKWEKKNYIINVDPSGGVLEAGQSTWFYRQHGDSFSRYNITKNYVPAEEGYAGTKYYRVAESYDPRFDSYSDSYAGADPEYNRRALYITEDEFSDYRSEFIDTSVVYKYEANAYSLMGWYPVREDGTTIENHPYNFTDPVTRNMTIRAVWRKSGLYYLKYEAVSTAFDENGNAHTVTGYLDDEKTITIENEPSLSEQTKGAGFDDRAVVNLRSAPEGYRDTDGMTWQFEGWQVYRGDLPVGGLLSPGDELVVDSELAVNKTITLRAVYAVDKYSSHIPRTVDLILDANRNASVLSGSGVEQDGFIGIYTNENYPSEWDEWYHDLNEGVWFDKQNNNFSVMLSDYADEHLQGGREVFSSDGKRLLLGWDENSDPKKLSKGAFIPEYYADSMIGVYRDRIDADHHSDVLYAVWEPKVYLTLVNDTDTELLMTLGGLDADAFSIINVISDKYERSVLRTDSRGRLTLPSGKTLSLVIPNGEDAAFSLNGDGGQLSAGRKLIIETDAAAPDMDFSAEYAFDDRFATEGILRNDDNGVKITFRSDEQYSLTLDNNYPSAPQTTVVYFNGIGGSYDLPEVDRSGYYFVGWAESSDGTKRFDAKDTALNDIFGSQGSKHKTLYAIWKSEIINVPVRYLLQYSNGTYMEITDNTKYLSETAKKQIGNVGSTTDVEVPKALAYNNSYSVGNYLNRTYRSSYNQVAYALGNSTASSSGTTSEDFGLTGIKNNNSTSGLPTLRNSRSGLIWTDGDNGSITAGEDAAVYVIFSEIQMMHITVKAENTGGMSNPEKEFYYTAVFSGKGTLGTERQTESFTLKSDETHIITLFYSTKNNYQSLTLTQSDAEGYRTAITQKLTDQSGDPDGSIDGLAYSIDAANSSDTARKNSDTTVIFKNDAPVPPPTAYRTHRLPFAVLLSITGAGFAALYFFKRRKDRHKYPDDTPIL